MTNSSLAVTCPKQRNRAETCSCVVWGSQQPHEGIRASAPRHAAPNRAALLLTGVYESAGALAFAVALTGHAADLKADESRRTPARVLDRFSPPIVARARGVWLHGRGGCTEVRFGQLWLANGHAGQSNRLWLHVLAMLCNASRGTGLSAAQGVRMYSQRQRSSLFGFGGCFTASKGAEQTQIRRNCYAGRRVSTIADEPIPVKRAHTASKTAPVRIVRWGFAAPDCTVR